MTDPADQRHRDLVGSELSNSIFLDAGAGAGKSTSLLTRILSLLSNSENPLPMSSIVAITFTERAGTDLRQRLRRALVKEIRQNHSTELVDALQNLDSAKVGTIHSFAQSILREFAIEAGLPPGFEVLADGASRRAAKQRCKTILESSPTLARSDSQLHSNMIPMGSILKFVEKLDSVKLLIDSDTLYARNLPDPKHLLALFRSRAGRVFVEIGDSCTNTQDTLFIKIQAQFSELMELLDNFDSLDKIALLGGGGAFFNRFAGGAKANWTMPVSEVKDLWTSLESDLQRLLVCEFENEVHRFIAEIAIALDEAARARCEDGMLEFDDLLSLTRQLLESNSAVRAKLHQKYRCILVDEFQDTDPVQWEIIKLITSDPSDEQQRRPLPGRLVVVGDPKQAIFSFRGADIATYQAAREAFKNFGQELQLSTNFRSTPDIINWVNSVFERAINETNQVVYQPLIPYRSNLNKRHPSVVVLRNIEGDEDYKGAEARLVAQAISTAVQGEWQVHPEDSEPGFQRGARFSDVAIIYPTRTALDDLLNEFEKVGIPYRAADSRLVMERPLVKGLVSLIRSVADPTDEFSTWSALKTPLFGCTEKELLVFRQKRGNWSAAKLTEDAAATKVGQILNEIIRVRQRSHLLSITEVIDEIVTRFHVFEIAAVSPQGAFEADCIRMVRGFAQRWQEDGGTGVVEFCDALDDLEGAAARVSFSAPDDTSDDAVQLMTIYGAKGLEFPIVAVAGMASQFYNRKESLGVKSRREIEFNFGARLHSAGWESWSKETNKQMVTAERMRVLYVAATRARDALIFSMVGKLTAENWSGLLRPYVPTSDDDINAYSPPGGNGADVAPMNSIDPVWLEDLPNVRARSGLSYVALPSGRAAEVLGLKPTTDESSDVLKLRDTSTTQMALEMRDGAAFGQACHSAMDFLMNYVGEISEEVIDLAVASAEASVLASIDIGDVTQHVRNALQSEVIQKALSADQRWPELYLSAPVSDGQYRLVEGFADLVFRDASGYTIVDYKTDQVIDLTTWQHYQEQLLSYAELFRRCTGFEASQLYVLHISSSGAELKTISRQ